MRSKSKVWIGLLCFVLIFGSFTVANADTLLFPVIAVNQPNVTTIISVNNWDQAAAASHLHYIYRYKDSVVGGSPNYTGGCATVEFTRPTHNGDLVSFDASGTLNSGNPLFNDTDSYGGTFSMPGTGPRRAYLLVTHSNASGTSIDAGVLLGGEATIMDIASGAAWGYRAIRDVTTTSGYEFINWFDRGGSGGDGVYTSISYGMWIFGLKQFTFFSPNEWTQKIFVTPIGGIMTSDRTAQVVLGSTVWDRMGTSIDNSGAPTVSVTCTAAIDLEDMFDSTVWSTIQSTGGWTVIIPASGDVIVYWLEYVVNNPTYGGTNNNAYLLSTYGFL
jgi:hypothetical protein